MSRFDTVQEELLHALDQLDIEEIEQVCEMWVMKNEQQGISQKAMDYCNGITDFVIQTKRERTGATV